MDAQAADALRHAMDSAGITDNDIRAGIAAICMGESRGVGKPELGYSRTSNDRIRQVFGGRVAGLTDERLDELKADDHAWFNFIYSAQNDVGRGLGNREPDDGYNFRGRGGIQITGRANYTILARDIGHPEVVDDPDLLSSDVNIGMAMTVAYIKRNYRGGGFDGMLRCVGNNTPDIEATKRRYYAQYRASGEFAAGVTGSGSEAVLDLPHRVMEFQVEWNAAHPGQTPLVVDGIVGPKTIAAGWVG